MCYRIGTSGIVSSREVPSVRRRLRGFAPDKLRARRIELKLSGAEVARVLGVALTTYSQWERGQSHPRIDTLARCAEEFGSEVSDFVSVPQDEEYLGDLRISRGLTQGMLASEIGVSSQYIGALERGAEQVKRAGRPPDSGCAGVPDATGQRGIRTRAEAATGRTGLTANLTLGRHSGSKTHAC
ncbi:helix-turn-helix domain-containing protein [Rhodococcoides fascians]|uniref:helix-turn-helix domain-containing protein n=1 Tax=Rhodococcoides fascians TaxID=1828 RepID=UPI0009EEA09E